MGNDAALHENLQKAAAAIRSAEALLIAAGAGMGVDSGLPDFRGPEGFWKAYPPFRGRMFSEVSNPAWFRRDPPQAWGFFGHRLNLYRAKQPHAGFEILRRWAQSRPRGYFVFTSNVDGHFQRAGFDAERIVECHGSIHHLQCVNECTPSIWDADGLDVAVEDETIWAAEPLPSCRHCGGLARPNILMFGDGEWIADRTEAQLQRYGQWLHSIDGTPLVVIEIGAGTAVPTVRHECERRADVLVRINLRDGGVPDSGISIPLGALEALEAIARL